jgi:hypothetical protein
MARGNGVTANRSTEKKMELSRKQNEASLQQRGAYSNPARFADSTLWQRMPGAIRFEN